MKEPDNSRYSSGQLQDNFSRTISYLRLSVTDRCNLRCLYCMPCNSPGTDDIDNSFIKTLSAKELLSYEEMLRVVSIGVSLGMSKLRLTGGEPLIRKGILGFIDNLSSIQGLEQIRLTTNGVLLADYKQSLYDAGVSHLNISLDTLDEKKFTTITGRDYFSQVMKGIEDALHLGFKIKINVVAMRGINDDEFADFVQFALDTDVQVRFIEFMPIGKGSKWNKSQYIKASTIQDSLKKKFTFTPLKSSRNTGPARMFTAMDSSGTEGKVGFISPISHHFCDKCNRLRLTSDGKLRACLLHDRATDLKHILRSDGKDKEIEQAIKDTIMFKPKNHGIVDDPEESQKPACHVQMSRIGG